MMEEDNLPPMPERPERDEQDQKRNFEFVRLSDEQFEQMKRQAVSEGQQQRRETLNPSGERTVETGTATDDKIVEKQDRIEDILRQLPVNIAQELTNG